MNPYRKFLSDIVLNRLELVFSSNNRLINQGFKGVHIFPDDTSGTERINFTIAKHIRMDRSTIKVAQMNLETSDRQFFVRAQRLICVFFILLLLKPATGNCQSYANYHRMISTAEEFYFLENNADSALFHYQKGFETFEFVFARDAVNAIQIAYREQKPLEYFLKTAFETGVTPSNLSNIPALKDFVQDSLPQLNVMRDYDLYRSRYVDRINVECLNRVYRLGIIDQLNKGNKGKYRNYDVSQLLFAMADRFGLPGEQNCGIENSHIHKELGSEAWNFLSSKDRMAEEDGRDLWYYTLDENSLIMHIPIVIMLHNYCTHIEYEQALQDAYLGGFMHPREIGCTYDNALRSEDISCTTGVNRRGIFGLNVFAKTGEIDRSKANQLRAEWGICSLETDVKKKEFEKLGFQFIWDYW